MKLGNKIRPRVRVVGIDPPPDELCHLCGKPADAYVAELTKTGAVRPDACNVPICTGCRKKGRFLTLVRCVAKKPARPAGKTDAACCAAQKGG